MDVHYFVLVYSGGGVARSSHNVSLRDFETMSIRSVLGICWRSYNFCFWHCKECFQAESNPSLGILWAV